MIPELTQSEKKRYHKHLQLPEVGEAGQLRLKAGSALVIGTGGLGSPVALYLAAAGVGRIGLLDSDKVELSNLQRQVLHSVNTIGELKVKSASGFLKKLNPEILIEEHAERFPNKNADALIAGYDVVVDCTDNLQTRLLMNRVCVKQHKPMVHGAVYRFEGQVSVFQTPAGPCYQCLYPRLPDEIYIPDPAKNGLLSTTPGVIGMIMANEVLKLLLGIGKPLIGRLLVIDLLSMRFQELHLKKNAQCPICSQ
jgi:sulfur-carrier protein adenylyltransferase/sulfurtransferase